MTEKLYRVKEVALLLNASQETIRRMIRKEQIKAIKLPTGTIRIPESEVIRLLGDKK